MQTPDTSPGDDRNSRKSDLSSAEIEQMFAVFGLATAEERAKYTPSNFGLFDNVAPEDSPAVVASHTKIEHH